MARSSGPRGFGCVFADTSWGPPRGRRRAGRGWWVSHHRRGRPRPLRAGSTAPHAWQWRDGAKLARRAIVAAAAIASRASAVTDRPLAKLRQESRNPAVRTQSPGAVCGQSRRRMGYPTPVGRRTLRRVARPAQHGGVADVERRTASGERNDVIDGEVSRSMGVALVARAPVAVLAAPGTEHAGAEALPGPRAVQGVVPAAAGLAGVFATSATHAAGDDTADRAELHGRARLRAVPHLTLVTLECTPVDIARSVVEKGGAVYSPVVLSLRDQEQSGSGALRLWRDDSKGLRASATGGDRDNRQHDDSHK